MIGQRVAGVAVRRRRFSGMDRQFAGELLSGVRGLDKGLQRIGLDLLGFVLQGTLDADRPNVGEADESEDASQV